MPKNLTPNHFDTAGIYVEGERSVFRFKKPVLASFMSGMLVPLGDPIPVFPGTKLDLNINAVIRSATMVVPPLDGLYIDFFTVWVPHRIVWNHMPQFLGDNDTTAWTQSASYVYPAVSYELINEHFALEDQMFAGNQDVAISNLSLADKYGLIFGVESNGVTGYPVASQMINVLGMRGYYFIWNYLFRDENYQRPVLFSKDDNGYNGEFGYPLRDYAISASDDFEAWSGQAIGDGCDVSYALLMPVNKFHDAFTSLLPQAQFDNGQGVALPLGDSAPVLDAGFDTLGTVTGQVTSTADYVRIGSNAEHKLITDLSAATAATVNELRSAIMTQRYLEALARGGRRMPEYYNTIYGVKNSAAAHDYPELLTRARYILGVNQVVAQADSSGDGWTSHLGDTGAYSLTNLREIPCCEKDFSEFGYLHILYCVRADNRYSQIIQPHFLKRELLEEYNPFFDHIGDVNVPNIIVNTHAAQAGNFGFQEAWWDERTQLAMATGCLNKVYGSLKYWILGEVLESSVTACSPGYLTFDPAVLNDIFVAPYYAYPQFIIDATIYGKKIARMSQHSIPGIVGRI